MRIKIIGFKCHVDVEYTFPNNGIILLKGQSGSGKTTLLQAIYWCLFGSLRSVYNNSGITNKCSVTIILDNMIIYRQKRPELLQITIGDKIYEDKVAQDIIIQKFGNKELWKACCYIEQKQRCTLLSGSNAERMEMLNQLSFNSEDPQNYISRISEELKEVNKTFIDIQARFTAEINLFKNDLEKKPVNPESVSMINNIETLQNEISNLTFECQRLHQEVLDQQRIIGIHSTLSIQYDKSQKQLNELPLKTESDMNTCYQLITQNKNRINDIDISITQAKLLISQAKEIEAQIKSLETQIQHVKQLELKCNLIRNEYDKIMLELDQKFYNYENYNNDNIQQLIWITRQNEQNAKQNEENIKQLELKLNLTKDEYNKVMLELNQKFTNYENYNNNNNNSNDIQQLIWTTKQNEQNKKQNDENIKQLKFKFDSFKDKYNKIILELNQKFPNYENYYNNNDIQQLIWTTKQNEQNKKQNDENIKQLELKLNSIKDAYNKVISVLDQTFPNYENYNNNNIQQLIWTTKQNEQNAKQNEQNIKQLELKLNLIKDAYNKIISVLDQKFPNYENYNNNNNIQQLIWTIKQNEQNRIKNMQECLNIKCEYSEKSLSEILNKLQNQLIIITDLEKKADAYKKLNNLELQFKSLGINENLLDKVDELELQSRNDSTTIAELKRGRDILKCPHCSKSLRYLDGNIVAGDREPVSQQQIEDAEKKYIQNLDMIKKIRIGNELYSQIKSLNAIFEDKQEIEEFMKNPKNSGQLRGFINHISKIQYIPESNISSSQLELLYQYQQTKQEMELIQQQISKIPHIPESSVSLSQLELLYQYQQIKQEMESVQQQISKIPHIPESDVSSSQLELLYQYQQIKQQMESIEQQILKIPYIPESDVSSSQLELLYRYQQIKQLIESIEQQISKIPHIPKSDVSSLQLELLYQYQQIKQQMESMEQQRSTFPLLSLLTSNLENLVNKPNDIPDIFKLEYEKQSIANEINKLENDTRHIVNIISQRKSLLQMLESYTNQLSQLILKPEINDIYRNCSEILIKKKQQLNDVLYTKEIMKRQSDLEKLRQDVLKCNDDITSLQRLKQNAINIECKQLEDTVNAINITMIDTLSAFFTDPISVTLKLYKNVKTTKSIKPGVNISIKYKGSEYDAVNQMSGGEGDRVSLALIMALNSVSISPFLLLDECMTSFDISLREECIRVLKMNSDKITICIDHGDIEGFYDRVVPIS